MFFWNQFLASCSTWQGVVTQLIGLTGSVIAITSFQTNKRKKLLLLQALCCVLWSVHYGVLGAITPVFLNGISLLRNGICYFNDHKWAASRLWLYVFLLLFLVCPIYTWSKEGFWSLLPAGAMVTASLAFWQKDTRRTRLIILFCSPFWIVYNLHYGSYLIVTEILNFISVLIAIFRFDNKSARS